MKNLKFNRKKIASLLVAAGICFYSNISIASDNQVKVVQINGKHVNVRLTPTTDTKDNIIGSVNTGDTFTYISHENGWYLVDYNGQNAYIYDSYGIELTKEANNINNSFQVNMAKVTGNNVNIRSSATTKADNIIGFADVTDYFRILDKTDDWYVIDYLGERGYIYSKYVDERMINQEDTVAQKMVYVDSITTFYSDTNGTYLSTLPTYQYAAVIKEENGYYKVRIDGVVGYIKKNNTHKLTSTFVAVDLGRQILKVYKNNKEVYRAHIISGRYEMPTDLGIYKIGHKLKDYQLTKDYRVAYWMQYNGNEGMHDAMWQKDKNFIEVANDAYDRFASGRCLTYATSHASHGCDNLQLDDAAKIYELVEVGDNVLVIEANDFIRDNLLSEAYTEQKIKKLV